MVAQNVGRKLQIYQDNSLILKTTAVVQQQLIDKAAGVISNAKKPKAKQISQASEIQSQCFTFYN